MNWTLDIFRHTNKAEYCILCGLKGCEFVDISPFWLYWGHRTCVQYLANKDWGVLFHCVCVCYFVLVASCVTRLEMFCTCWHLSFLVLLRSSYMCTVSSVQRSVCTIQNSGWTVCYFVFWWYNELLKVWVQGYNI